ncbi:hypothetical protein DPMN_169485 [Dreissena polymorpha]|uniref:Uncharacterized protein n=1 Tax=Dreissena polymorpha TaxID=45954 RepID=A0A9D4IDN8_DREPO|nr:hypothetical protein DPMN_169485 [Dreissena polymorpha]
MRAIGMKAANLPASGIELVVVTRSCGYQANDTANICKSIYDAPLEALNAFMSKVSQLKKSFE